MIRILLLLLLYPAFVFAQQREVFRIDSLTKEGILLDKGWKWHAGDNPEWAKVDFDDAAWQSINPTKDIFDLPQIPKNGKIGWLRLTLSLDSAIRYPLVLMIEQSGASEIYLNGNLIHHYGILSSNPKQIKAFDPLFNPLPLPINNNQLTQTLSIRYALQSNITYPTFFGKKNSGFKAQLISTENGIEFQTNIIKDQRNNIQNIGIFGVLSILFLSIYLFFPKRLANLYFGIYCMLQLILSYTFYKNSSLNAVEFYNFSSNLAVNLQITSYLLMLLAVYTILEQKKGITYWFFVVLGLSTIVFTFFSPKIGWILFVIISSFLNVDITFVSFIAIKNKKRGAWIIALGAVIFIICWSIFLLQYYQIFNYPSNLFYLTAVLSIPVAFAIFLSFDFGLVNKELQQKFIENEKLSEEKQQILFAQNERLEKQVTERTAELNQSLNVLKATQSQLIQSEKLASLGELTAGIAHEIQNPLNFVNNFSDLSVELLEEMETEFRAGKSNDAFEIAADLKQNLSKINHHGQRASAIVKGMLEHSRTSSGTKVVTDINALADEYLRLAYHGLRAKDSSFNATMETHFDSDLPKIEVIPQDIGRVLLNLINNAFYAVNQRNSTVETLHATSLQYQPTVTITTRKLENAIEISVKDNGNGIPENIKDKIFQPFFTTKPTGQGTGLGLSLAYDIVTKGHGGTIEVDSLKGEGTAFILKLPIQLN